MSPTISRSNNVVRTILNYIHDAGLSEGDRLPSIRELSAVLELGPHLIRDGLMQAQSLGLIRIHPRAGSFVKSLNYLPLVEALNDTVSWGLMQTDQNLFHVIDARILIEMQTVRLAARLRTQEQMLPLLRPLKVIEQPDVEVSASRNADLEFHLEIARIAANPVLVILLQSLLELLRPCFNTMSTTNEEIERRNRTHLGIYQAILQRNEDLAAELMSDHLNLARESLIRETETADQLLGGDR
ncbi:MAG: FCD domain-containing protein [Planctomycetaceae bacterium]